MLNWILASAGILLWGVGFDVYFWQGRLIELWARLRKPEDSKT